MKKIILLTLLAILSISVVFAGGGQEEGPIVLRLGDNQPDGFPTVIGDLEFARLVEERSNGRIKIEVYNNAQLGDQTSVIEQVQFGGVDFVRTSIAPLSLFDPNIDALQLPFLYRDADHMWKVLNGPVGEELLGGMEDKGLVGLTYYDAGSRHFYNTIKPIYTVDDLAGMKIRIQESALMVDFITALGAVPTPMAFGEVYSALKTGVVDGAENSYASYDAVGHYEVAQYFSLTEHTRVPEMLVASKITMDKLSAEDQEMIKQAARDSQIVQIQAWAEYEKASEEKVRAAGNKINKINNQADFAAAMQPLYNKQPAEIKSLVERIQAVD